MIKFWLIELVVICVAAGLGIQGSAGPVPAAWRCGAGTQTLSLEVNGTARSLRLHVPAGAQEPAALVLALHGYSLRAEDMEVISQLSTLADREGFISVYPQAQGLIPEWDLSPEEDNPDAAFIQQMIFELETSCGIDPDRVFVTGFSNGAAMTERLACLLPEQIAAIAPVSGSYPAGEACNAQKPMPMMAFHGDADPSANYDGEEGRTKPVPQWAADWALRSGCSSSFELLPGPEGIEHQKWTVCPAAVEVHLVTVKGLGHNWPRTDWGQADSGMEAPIDASEMMWTFFKSFSDQP